jgi:hypothetical protein
VTSVSEVELHTLWKRTLMIYAEIMNWLTAHWNFCSWVLLSVAVLILLGSMPVLFPPRGHYIIRLPQPVRQPDASNGRPSTYQALPAPRR